MIKYLITCRCGQQLRVQSSQAGEQIACKCGAMVDVPTLRGLAALPQVEEQSSTSHWSKTRGLCFVGGIAWGVLGAAVTWWLWSLASRPVDLSIFDEKAEEFSAKTDQLSPYESLTYWRMYRDMPDQMLTSPQRIKAAATRNTKTMWLTWAAGLTGAVGFVGAMLSAFYWRPAPRATLRRVERPPR